MGDRLRIVLDFKRGNIEELELYSCLASFSNPQCVVKDILKGLIPLELLKDDAKYNTTTVMERPRIVLDFKKGNIQELKLYSRLISFSNPQCVVKDILKGLIPLEILKENNFKC